MSVRRLTSGALWSRAVAALTATVLAATGLAVVGASAASADTAPPAGEPATVTADSLPTVQHNGVVWQQALTGNTVYAGGEFTRARPAGAAAGTQEVVRNNLLRFDVRTGVLDSSWAPNPNAQVRAVVKSPDGSRVYIGGNFTSVSGVNRYRIAAFDAATGDLITSFNAGTNSQVRAIAATNTTVYVGGIFTQAGNASRTRLAAFSASTGAVLPWNPTVDDGSVSALTVSPDGSTVIVGGNFLSFNGDAGAPDGLARVDAVTGASLPFPATSQIRNGGSQGSILGLSGDADNMYGVGYTFGRSGGTLEGVFAADWDSGTITWVADCHGDTYAVHPQGDVIYSASHSHYCGNVGGTPQFDEWQFLRANALTKEATHTVGREHLGYTNFEGTPAPTVLNWYPDLDTGLYTGQNQGPWAVTGDSRYIVMGGEFLNVNFRRQQGLVRFAVSDIAPNDVGPRFTGADFTPTARPVGSGAVRVSWTANSDFDNEDLTYTVLRDGSAVWSGVKQSVVWKRPEQGHTDTGLAPGSQHTYAVRVTDPDGNSVTSPSVQVTANGTGPVSDYALAVAADGASHHWRFGEASGGASDSAGTADAAVGTAVTRGTAGAIAGDPTSAYTLGGSSDGRVVAPVNEQGMNELSVEAWVRTTSTAGGWVVGFGNSSSQTGTSSRRDRQLYVDSAGRAQFGASPGQNRTVRSPGRVNDGEWHHLVGTMTTDGMRLYVDGALVASRADNATGRNTSGYWRIGGDNLSGWPNQPSSSNFSGAVDEVAVYPFALTAATVAAHHGLGTTGAAPQLPPVAAFTASPTDLSVAFDASGSSDPDGTVASYAWDFGDGSTGTGATPSHDYAASGTYEVTLTVTDDDGLTDDVSHDVTVTAPAANQAPTAQIAATTSALRVDVDGSASTDPDGTVVSYTWDFGDGSSAATGATASHTYAAAGTYDVTLTVTDDDSATGSTTEQVTVTAPPADAPFALDGFGRTVSNGWGDAETGGAWSVVGGAANFSVAPGLGTVRVVGAGYRLSTFLPVSATSTDLRADVSVDVMPSGSGTDLELAARTTSTSDGYRARLKMLPTGVVRASLVATSAGSTSTVAQVNVPGLTYAAGDVLSVRVQADGTSPTQLRLKVWQAGQAEPGTWTVQGTSSTAALQTAGGIGTSVYTSSSTTTLPQTVTWRAVQATAVQP